MQATTKIKLNPAVLSAQLPKVSFQGRQFVVEPPEQFKERTLQLAKLAALAGKVQIPKLQPHVTFSLAQYQTPIRDQKDRGVCWAFAGIAAMEACYKRKYGVSLDLSEQYAAHMEKCGEMYPDYVTNNVPHENNSSFWGNQGSSSILENLQRIAVPEEHFAPYKTETELDTIRKAIPASGNLDWNSTQEQLDAFEYAEQNIPLAARQNAKYRVTAWQAVGGNPSTDDLEKVISGGHEVVIDIDLKWKWDATKSAYDYDSTNAGGGHCVLLIGYDKTAQIFTIKNSWGGTQYLQVTYNFIKNCCSWGHYVTDVCDPKTDPQKKAFWIGDWNMDHDGWRGSLVIRRFTDMHNSNENAPTKLGDYYRDGKRYDVNGYFVDDGQGMVFWIAAGTNRIQQGTETGQRFDTYFFSWDPADGGGRTTWNNVPYGALLKRAAIPSKGSGQFHINDWLGTYNMNHDGWRGTLTIHSVTPGVNASYKDVNGKVLTVAGSVNASQPHELTLFIKFAADNNQKFDLLHHTWEKGIFSGLTYWGGRTFGVQAFLS